MKNPKLYMIAALAALCSGFPYCQFAETGKPADFTDSPPALDQKGEGKLWTTNDVSGISIDCYCKISPQVACSPYSVLQRCRLSFSTNGILTSAELLPERVRLMTRCTPRQELCNLSTLKGRHATPDAGDASPAPAPKQ